LDLWIEKKYLLKFKNSFFRLKIRVLLTILYNRFFLKIDYENRFKKTIIQDSWQYCIFSAILRKKLYQFYFLRNIEKKIYINFIFSAILRKNLYQFYFLRNIEKKFMSILQYCHLVGNSQLTNGSPGLFTEKSGNIRPVSDKLPPYFRKTLELNGISRHCYNFDET